MAMREPTMQGASGPSRAWYVLALAVFLAGMAAFALFLITQIRGLDRDSMRLTVPGQAEFNLVAGRYTIFREFGGSADGRVVDRGDITGMRVSVQRPGGGAEITLTPDSSSRYSYGNLSGQSIFTFTIAEPGLYRVAGAFDDGRTSPQALLSLNRGFVANLLKIIFGGIAIAFGGAILGGAIAMVVFVKRRRARAPQHYG